MWFFFWIFSCFFADQEDDITVVSVGCCYPKESLEFSNLNGSCSSSAKYTINQTKEHEPHESIQGGPSLEATTLLSAPPPSSYPTQELHYPTQFEHTATLSRFEAIVVLQPGHVTNSINGDNCESDNDVNEGSSCKTPPPSSSSSNSKAYKRKKRRLKMMKNRRRHQPAF